MRAARWAGRRERGSATLIRLMMWLSLTLGWSIGQALLYPITLYFVLVLRGGRQASREFLDRALGRPATTLDVFRHFFAFSCVLLDRLFLLSNRLRHFEINVTGLNDIKLALSRSRGCMLLGSHLGSFEVLRVVARRSPVPVKILMYRGNTRPYSRLVEELDPMLADSIIEIGEPEAMLRVHESVARGEIVGILADRAPQQDKAVKVPFLGDPAAFPTGPLVLAAILGAPVVLFFGVRTGHRRYQVHFEHFADESPSIARAAPRISRTGSSATLQGLSPMPGSIHSIGSISMISGNIARPHYDRRSLNLLAMLLPLSRFGISAAAAEGPPRTIADLMHLLAQVVESRSTFTEVKTIAALTVPLYASGELLYRRPDYLEKVTEQPRPERMVVEGDRLTISTAGEPAREIDLVSQEMIRGLVDAIRGTLAGKLALLQQNYRVEMHGDLTGWRLTLTPTDPAVKLAVSQITIEGIQDGLQFIHTVQANGDESRMTISRVT